MNPPTGTKSRSFDWSKMANRLLLIVGIGIVLNLVFTYFISDGFQLANFLQFSSFWLLAAFALAIFPWVCHAIELKIWTSFFKIHFPFRDCIRIAVATDLGSAITPTMVGGGPIKVGMLVHGGMPIGQATAMLTLTALEDLFFFLIVIPLSFVFTDPISLCILPGFAENPLHYLPNILVVVSILSLATITGIYFLKKFGYLKRILAKIQAIFRDFMAAIHLILKDGKLHLAGATLAIFLRWVSRFFILLCLVKGLDLQANYTKLFLSQWMIDLVMTATPTPGAIGGAEGAFYFIFKSILPKSQIGLIMTVWRFFSYYLLLLLAAIFLNMVKIKSRVVKGDIFQKGVTTQIRPLSK